MEFHIDGEDLGSRVKAALGDEGFDDVLPWCGGDYKIDETVLGESARRDGAEGAILFACGCGQYACSGVSADVIVSGDTLTLRNVSTWRGGQLVLARIEPIILDRQQFEAAVAKLHRNLAEWRPPPKAEVHGEALLTLPARRAESSEGGK
ncbi:MAG: hypothetical protein JWO31_3829 [Phycisphaerales bacterium]|nr:hypothetical protein [Phycisphaerales bacterium]